jgi:hypothetical protein
LPCSKLGFRSNLQFEKESAMRCPKCSYISFDDQVACAKCKLQLDGKNALPFQGTAIRAASVFFLRALPAAEEDPSFEPVAEESFEDSTADLYRQLEAEGMGAGLTGQSTEEELDLSLADAGSNESLLFDDLSRHTPAGSATGPVFGLQAEEEIPALELEPEEEVHSLAPQAEEESLPFDLEPEEEVHSLAPQAEEEPLPFDLEPEEEVHSLAPQAEEEPLPFDLEPEEEVHSLAPQVERTPPDEVFTDFRPAIDDGEPGAESDVGRAAPAGQGMALSAREATETAPTSHDSMADMDELDLIDLESDEEPGQVEPNSFRLAGDEEPKQVEPNSFRTKTILGDGLYDLSDLMGGGSAGPSADGPTIADNADMLLDLTFAGETSDAVNEPGYDSRLTGDDDLDLSLELDDD